MRQEVHEGDSTVVTADGWSGEQSASGITGILVYDGGAFLQVLEGDRDVVERTFASIAADRRHSRVTKIIQEPIAERAFGTWTMGYPRITRAELSTIPGLNDFFGRGQSLLDLEEGRAKLVLEAFKDGRWRQSIS